MNEGILDAVIEISRRQAKILEAMRDALERGDNDEALDHARELCGLPRKSKTDAAPNADKNSGGEKCQSKPKRRAK